MARPRSLAQLRTASSSAAGRSATPDARDQGTAAAGQRLPPRDVEALAEQPARTSRRGSPGTARRACWPAAAAPSGPRRARTRRPRCCRPCPASQSTMAGSGTLRPIARWCTSARASVTSALAARAGERRPARRPAQPPPGDGSARSITIGRIRFSPSDAQLPVERCRRRRGRPRRRPRSRPWPAACRRVDAVVGAEVEHQVCAGRSRPARRRRSAAWRPGRRRSSCRSPGSRPSAWPAAPSPACRPAWPSPAPPAATSSLLKPASRSCSRTAPVLRSALRDWMLSCRCTCLSTPAASRLVPPNRRRIWAGSTPSIWARATAAGRGRGGPGASAGRAAVWQNCR